MALTRLETATVGLAPSCLSFDSCDTVISFTRSPFISGTYGLGQQVILEKGLQLVSLFHDTRPGSQDRQSFGNFGQLFL